VPGFRRDLSKRPPWGKGKRGGGGSAFLRLWEVRVAHCSGSVQMVNEKNSG